jgi:hypothetical protein
MGYLLSTRGSLDELLTISRSEMIHVVTAPPRARSLLSYLLIEGPGYSEYRGPRIRGDFIAYFLIQKKRPNALDEVMAPL